MELKTVIMGMVIVVLAVALAGVSIYAVSNASSNSGNGSSLGTLFEFQQVNLTSSVPGVAPNTDPYLVDAWGLQFGDPGRIWVNAQSGYSIVYNGSGDVVMIDDAIGHQGQLVPLRVEVPNDPNAGEPAPLTGMVFSPTHGQPGAPFDGDAFVFVSEDGVIAGWQPTPVGEPLNATIRVDNYASGAIYKGVTSYDTPSGWWLYAANFAQGRIDVFNATYQPVWTAGAFVDPSLPAGYAPFNVKAMDGEIYVTYAKQSIDKANDVKGVGNGYVDIFTVNGVFVKRLISAGPLNSPWGLALTPSDFGALSNTLLVGDFGDGYVHVFNATNGAYLGVVAEGGRPLQIDEIWSLTFGSNNGAGDSNQLFFSAGSSAESQGIFGELDYPLGAPT